MISAPDTPAVLRTTILLAVIVSAAPLVAGEPPRDGRLVTVPRSIPADLSRDVTGELNDFLAGVPDGATVRFPAEARYRVEGTVLIDGKSDLVIDGNGALLRTTTSGESHSKQENYAGWRATRNRAHVRIKGGKRIVVRNLTIDGPHPDAGREGTYDADREAQHGFDLAGVEDCIIDDVTVHDVYGDCVYMAKVRGVVVRDSTLTRCGRQGIAVATGEDVLIEDNEIGDSRRGVIDVEPYGREWRVWNIRIVGNRLGGSRLLLLPMGGSGTIGGVFVADNVNTAPNGTPAVANLGRPGQHRGPFVMVGNRFTIGGSPAAGLRVRHNDGLFVAGNVLTFPESRRMTAVDAEGSTGAVVGNRFVGAAEVLEENKAVSALANTTNADADPPASEWKRVPGGFAVRVRLEDGEVVALLRGGPRSNDPPERIEGYGRSTSGAFAWFHVRDGKVVEQGTRGAATPGSPPSDAQ